MSDEEWGCLEPFVILSAGLGQNLGMSGGLFPRVAAGSPAELRIDSASDVRRDDTLRSGTAEPAAMAPAVTNDGPDSTGNSAPAAAMIATTTPAEQLPTPTAAAERETAGNAANDQAEKRAAPSAPPKHSTGLPELASRISDSLGFRGYPDLFKMLLLAFLAGFAERLVPDALDRLTRRSPVDPGSSAAPPAQAA